MHTHNPLGNFASLARSTSQEGENLNPPSDCKPNRKTSSQSVALLWLALLAFATHAPSLFGGFIFDDVRTVEHRAQPHWSHVLQFFTHDQSAIFGSNFYRPAVSSWYEALYSILGTHAALWHLATILLHVTTTLLVYRLALVIIEDHAIAGAAAALFAVHPAHVEIISWASAMGDPLMTILMLASVLTFVRWMRGGKFAWWVSSYIAGTACIFTKETGVVLPILLLATALAIQRREKAKLPILIATAPFFVSAIAFLIIRSQVLRGFSHPNEVSSGTAHMVFTLPSALMFYLRHLFWPAVVSPYYPIQYVKSWHSGDFLGPLLWLAISSCVLAYFIANRRRFWLCVVWTIVPLAPGLYLKAFGRFELVHDRFLYAPLVGFCIAVAILLRWTTEYIETRTSLRVFPLVSTALVALCVYGTVDNSFWWQNNKTLFTRALTVTPDNPKALINLSDAYIRDYRYPESITMLNRALAIDSEDSIALANLGRISMLQGDNQQAETYFAHALKIKPTYELWMHLSIIELRRNRIDAAELAAKQALALDPTGEGAHFTLGSALLAKGDRVGAAREFQEELQLFPGSIVAQTGIARSSENRAH